MTTESHAEATPELRILILEDSPTDAELTEHELRRAGVHFTAKRVDSREAFVAALESFRPDIILSDYRLPDFDGLSALKLVRRDHPEIPVIMVTGALADTDAVELLSSGARDYVLKDRLARLAPAVQHVLSAEKGIRARKAAEHELHETYRQVERARDEWNSAFDAMRDLVFFHDREYRITRCNRAYARQAGLPFQEIIGRPYWEIFPKGDGPLASCDNEMAESAGSKEEELALHSGETFISRSFSARDAEGDYLFSVHIMEDVSERKRTEELIRKNNQLLETVFSSIHVMVAYLDRDFNFIKVNKAYADAARHAPEFFPGKNHFDLFPDEQRAAIFRKVAETGASAIHSAQAFNYFGGPERSPAYWDWRLEPVKGTSGKVEGLVLSLLNVTEQTLAVQKIQAASKYARSLIEASLDPLVTISAEGKITDVNAATEHATGRSRAELIGADFSDYFTEPERARAGYRQVFAQGFVTDYPLALRHRDGRVMQVLYNASLFRDAAGNVAGVFAAARDITERKRAEEALRQSEAEIRALVENSPVAMLVDVGVESDEKIEMMNRQFTELFGYTISDVPNVSQWWPLAYPDVKYREQLRGEWLSKVEKAIRNHGSIEPTEATVTCKDGSLRHVRVSLASIGNRNIITFEDFTQRKRMEDALLQSEASLADAQQLAHIGNWSWDLAANAMAWSPEHYRIYNFDPAQPAPSYEACLKTHTADSARKLDEAVQRAIEHGEPYALELELAKADVAGKWIYARGEVKRDALGKITGLYGTAQDITERKKSEKALQRLNRALKALSAGNHSLVHSRDELELMQGMCRAITDGDNYPLAWVGVAQHDETRSIKPVAVAGSGQGYVDALNLTWADEPLGRGPTGTAVRTGQAQISQDFAADPRMLPWREAAAKYGLCASIALPLREGDEVTAALTLYAAEPGSFDPQEVALLEEMAEDLSFGLTALRTRSERDRARAERQHYVERLRTSLEEALQAISATVEMRDPYTAGHQRRVADLAAAIAREMGLPEEQVHGIHLAGIVHDLGKIHVPAEILSKPVQLTEIEFNLIKIHPQAGYDILKGIAFPWPIAQAVLQHHERLDGTGYPRGLKGDEIIAEARILAVADVVEAMASHRPYRPSLGLDAALSEIGAKRAAQFDPAAVDACLTLFTKRSYILPA